MSGAVFLEGDKVNLRTVEEKDLEFLRDTYNLPEVRDQMSHDRPANLEQQRDFFENVICSDENVNLAISVDEEMVGLVSLKPKQEGVGQIGIWIHPDHHGKGYGTEASKLLIGHAFDEMRYHKVYAQALESNEASQKIWEKLGFTQEGELREQTFRNGEYEDTYYYGLLEEEWD